MRTQVLLVPTHHALYADDKNDSGPFFLSKIKMDVVGAVELTEEMLRWPLHDYTERRLAIIPRWEAVYRNAFGALLDLGPFTAMATMRVHRPFAKSLAVAKRDWAQIYLDDRVVANFSHDRRKANEPYATIAHWPEIDDLDQVLAWDVNGWKKFFLARIGQVALAERQEADDAIANGQAVLTRVERVLAHTPAVWSHRSKQQRPGQKPGAHFISPLVSLLCNGPRAR